MRNIGTIVISMLAGALLCGIGVRVYRILSPDYSSRLLNPDKVLFVLDQKPVKVSSLDGPAKQALLRLESQLARNLRSNLDAVIVANDKKTKGKTARRRPTKAQVAAEYQRIASSMPRGTTFELSRESIAEVLEARQEKVRSTADVERLKAAGRLQIVLGN